MAQLMTDRNQMIVDAANTGNAQAQAECIENPTLFRMLDKTVQKEISADLVKTGRATVEGAAKMLAVDSDELKDDVFDTSVAQHHEAAIEAAVEAAKNPEEKAPAEKSPMQKIVLPAQSVKSDDLKKTKAAVEDKIPEQKKEESVRVVSTYEQAVTAGMPRAPMADHSREAAKQMIDDVRTGKAEWSVEQDASGRIILRATQFAQTKSSMDLGKVMPMPAFENAAKFRMTPAA